MCRLVTKGKGRSDSNHRAPREPAVWNGPWLNKFRFSVSDLRIFRQRSEIKLGIIPGQDREGLTKNPKVSGSQPSDHPHKLLVELIEIRTESFLKILQPSLGIRGISRLSGT